MKEYAEGTCVMFLDAVLNFNLSCLYVSKSVYLEYVSKEFLVYAEDIHPMFFCGCAFFLLMTSLCVSAVAEVLSVCSLHNTESNSLDKVCDTGKGGRGKASRRVSKEQLYLFHLLELWAEMPMCLVGTIC